MKKLLFIFVSAFATVSGSVVGQTPEPTKIRVGRVELTYVEKGSGEPVILLHGGQSDYRSWLPHLSRFAEKFHVIAYSRRYNYPNNNPIDPKDHSANVEAGDLAAFIDKLKLKRVHLVGTSMGALTALIYAMEHPENVASLVLAEPPIHAWVAETRANKDFMIKVWVPAGDAFRAGDNRGGMRILVNGFGGEGTFERLSPEAEAVAMQNARFFSAATLSRNPLPNLPKDNVRSLKMPVLIIRGEYTIEVLRLIVEELQRVQPDAERAIIPKAGHGSPRENPQAFTDTVLGFITRVSNKTSRP